MRQTSCVIKALIVVIALVTAPGCATGQYVSSGADDPTITIMLSKGSFWHHGYIIDPQTRNCFFAGAGGGDGMAAIPCESLMRFPQAARYITWLAPPRPAAPAASVAPASP